MGLALCLLAGLGFGVLLAWLAPVALWPAALVLMGVWLGRWPRPGVRLLALTVGVILAAPLLEPFNREPRPILREVQNTAEQAESWAGVGALQVRNGEGAVTVSGSDGWRFRTLYQAGSGARGVPRELLTELRGQTLHLTGLEPSWPQTPLRGATAAVRAAVPRRVGVSVYGRSGDVSIEDVAAARVETNLGDVTVNRVAGSAVALTDVGNVFMAGVGGGLEASTQVGDIWLEPAPGAAPVLARTDVGDIALVLPPEANARIMATSVSRGLPPGFRRESPTRGELVLGDGRQLIVLETRIGRIQLVRR